MQTASRDMRYKRLSSATLGKMPPMGRTFKYYSLVAFFVEADFYSTSSP